ncbi:hypothetical protein WDU94_007044 [Cyamophila willieti]
MFAIEFWAFLISCTIYLAIDAFYFSTIYICCGQLRLIQDSMKNMFPSDEEIADENLLVEDRNSRSQKKREPLNVHKKKTQTHPAEVNFISFFLASLR